MKLRSTAVVLSRCQSPHFTTLPIQGTKTQCMKKYQDRAITTTTRNTLRIPKSSLRSTDLLSSSTTKSKNSEEGADLWAALPQETRDVEDAAMDSVVNSWYNPSPKTNFPYSRDPFRNSSTTPRIETPLSTNYKPGSSSQLIIDATQKQRNQKDWTSHMNDSIITGVNSITANILKVMSVKVKPKTSRQPMEFKPYSGRAVMVSERIDVAQAFKKMEMSCGRNRIRREANAQRFHERPGLKRKRLKRLRWRQRFLDGFRATVGRVQELWRQGW